MSGGAEHARVVLVGQDDKGVLRLHGGFAVLCFSVCWHGGAAGSNMAIDGLSAGLFAWIAVVMLVAGLIQGTLGFGFPFIATPLIALASDMRTAIVAVLLPTLAVIFVALAASGPLKPTLARFWMMPLYQVIGAAAGTWLFVSAPDLPYLLVLALMTLFYLNLDRLGKADWPVVRRHERRFAPVSGLLSGVFEGTANVAAPPLIIFYLALGLAPAMLVQAMNLSFLVGKTTQLVVLAAGGGVTAAQWLANAAVRRDRRGSLARRRAAARSHRRTDLPDVGQARALRDLARADRPVRLLAVGVARSATRNGRP